MTAILQSISDFGNAIPGAAAQGLIWGIMAIGLYITYKVLELSDLTVDGSFCTGGAVCVLMMVSGYSVWMAMLGALLAGVLAGAITGFLHTKCKIPAILAGILTQLGLWTVNQIVLGVKDGFGSISSLLSLPLFGDRLVKRSYLDDVHMGTRPFYEYPLFTVGLVTIVVIAILYWFFGTERGASIRATGANEHMARAQGINTNINKLIGLMISNGLVALAGALFAQYNGRSDINDGRGAIVIGLAAIIIGDVLFGRLFKNFALKLLAVSLGSAVYFMVLQTVLTFDTSGRYMKLCSAIVVAIFLTVPNVKTGKYKKQHKAVKEDKAC